MAYSALFANLKKGFFAYILLILVFSFGMILVCSFPSSLIKKNIGISLSTLKLEGQYPYYGSSGRQIVLDNFTDSLMLSTAYAVDSDDPLKSAFVNKRYDTLIAEGNQISNLEKLYREQEVSNVYYERYWHGYMLYLRPLLTFFPYSTIRIILTICLFAVIAGFVIIAWKQIGATATVAILAGLLSIDIHYLGHSMQFVSIFIIGLLGSIYMMVKNKNVQLPLITFFTVGSFTSFGDLLTVPLFSLGIMLLIATKLNRTNIQKILVLSFSWFIGYLLMWASKWVIAEVMFSSGAVTRAFDQIVYRTLHRADENFSYIQAVQLNVSQLIDYYEINKIIVLSILVLMIILFLRYKDIRYKKIMTIMPWIIMFFIPYVWYLIAANHSYLHPWYTYRSQFMSVVALLFIYIEFMDSNKIMKDVLSIRSLLNPSQKTT